MLFQVKHGSLLCSLIYPKDVCVSNLFISNHSTEVAMYREKRTKLKLAHFERMSVYDMPKNVKI